MNKMKWLAMVTVTLSLFTTSALSGQVVSPSLQVGSEAKVKLRVALWDYEYQDYDQKLIHAFCEKNPDIKVEVVTCPNSYYGSKLITWLAGNEPIDVVYLNNIWQYKEIVDKKALMNLDVYVEQEQMNLSQFREGLEVNGGFYGIPYRSDWSVLYYNKSLFDEENIPYPDNEMTWSAFRELGKRMTSDEGESKIYGIQANFNVIGYYILPHGEDGLDFNFLNGDLEKFRRGLALFDTIQNKDKSAIDYNTNLSIHSDQRYFELGRTAMFINGTWFANYLKKDMEEGNLKFKWGMVKVPIWPDETQKTKLIITPIGITNKTEHIEEAWRFVKFITGKEGAHILASEMIVPAQINEETIKTYVSNSEFPSDCTKAITDHAFYFPKHTLAANEISMIDMAYSETYQVISNNKSIEEAMITIQEAQMELNE